MAQIHFPKTSVNVIFKIYILITNTYVGKFYGNTELVKKIYLRNN